MNTQVLGRFVIREFMKVRTPTCPKSTQEIEYYVNVRELNIIVELYNESFNLTSVFISFSW